MNKTTIKALHGSVRKWIAIVEWRGEDRGASNCPLCKEFAHRYDEIARQLCTGCPVRERTGKDNCRGTPYHVYVDHGRAFTSTNKYDARYLEFSMPFNPVTQRAAENEALFLISLLPEAEQKRYME